MQQRSQPVFARHDTFFGVCEAIGQDFGFNANYLRLAFALTILLAPTVVIGTYVGLGLVVAVSRLIFPPRPVKTADTVVELVPAPRRGTDEDGLALAA